MHSMVDTRSGEIKIAAEYCYKNFFGLKKKKKN